VLNFSTNHAFIQQLLVEHSLNLSLSHDDLLNVPCDKDDLCDNTSAIHVLKPHTCAEINHIIHIASTNDELKPLSSLNTLGYIEFEVFCNLNCLEDGFIRYTDLPWFSRHTYYAIGKYNSKGQYMIHRVYICGNQKSPFVVQNCNRLEGCHTTKIIIPCSSSVVLKNLLLHCLLLVLIFAG
jgi:hypothetical protein